MKVFISHQSADSFTAKKIADHLQHFHGIPSYLDVIDPYIGMRGEDLAAHIRTQMGQYAAPRRGLLQHGKLSVGAMGDRRRHWERLPASNIRKLVCPAAGISTQVAIPTVGARS